MKIISCVIIISIIWMKIELWFNVEVYFLSLNNNNWFVLILELSYLFLVTLSKQIWNDKIKLKNSINIKLK